MWSITSLAPTLQQVVGAGADTRMKRDNYISEVGKAEEARYLDERRKNGKRVAYLQAYYSSVMYHISHSIPYQCVRYLMVTAAFLTIAFAVNGSVNSSRETAIYDGFNVAIDTCFIIDGIVKAIAVFSYAKRLETYDILNARMGAEELGQEVIKKHTPMRIFKNCGFVDCVIAIFCLVYNGQEVADWFRLIRIVIISIWALENEPRIAILLSGIGHGFRAMSSLLALMLLINVIFASIAIATFSENDPYNFGSLMVAMWTLFEMSTMEGWAMVLNINRLGCDSVPNSDYELRTNTSVLSIFRNGGEFFMPVCIQPTAQPFPATIVFLTYMVIVGFILTSITIGAISTGINERFDVLRSQQDALQLEEVDNASDASDKDGDSDNEGKDKDKGESRPGKGGKDSSLITGQDQADFATHHDIYNKDESFEYSHEGNAIAMVNTSSKSLGDLTGGSGNYSDLSDHELKKSKLFVPPTLKYKSASHQQDQFSFRTVKRGETKEECDEEYDIFVTEVNECLDMIRLERSVNQGGGSGARKINFSKRSTSNNYLRGQLTKTVTGLKKSDLKFNEIKSKNFHILMYKFKKIVYGDVYGFIMLMFILMAALFEIFTLSNPAEDLHNSDEVIYKVQLMIQLVFTLDIFLRFVAMFPRYHKFLLYQWNLFDFIIVMALWLPFMIDILEKYIRLLRVLRLVALIKFMKWIPQLSYILDAITSCFRLLLYTVLLMGMCFYYFAVAGVLLFKDNDYEHFGKLHTSFLSMVSVSSFN